MDLQPVHVMYAALAVMIAAPVVGAVLAFLSDTTVRKIGRWILAVGWLSCAAAVIFCIRLAGRQSAGIGNHIGFLIAVFPAILGFVWFVVWMVARRLEYLRSLPPDVRRVEELASIEEGIEQVSRDLREKKGAPAASSFRARNAHDSALRSHYSDLHSSSSKRSAQNDHPHSIIA